MKIRVPASTANFGPGFDAIGCALTLYLELEVRQLPGPDSSIVYAGESSEIVPLDHGNLILRSAHYFYQRIQRGVDSAAAKAAVEKLIHQSSSTVANGNGRLVIDYLPHAVSIQVHNQIPLSRGLGSSATAIVAAALLTHALWQWKLSRDELFSYILELESHPDNVGASLFGSLFVGYVRNGREITRATSLSSTTAAAATTSPIVCGHLRLPWNRRIRAVCVVPAFPLSTETARQVLPQNYPRADCVHNIQRASVLVAALCSASIDIDPWLVHGALNDRLHQPYRAPLIPGMTRMLDELTPETVPGLLGIVLSGAV
jgi:homoserine kinase